MKVKEALEQPESMWDQIERAANDTFKRPPDSFTVQDLRERYPNTSYSKFRRLLERMLKDGDIVKGGSGNATYYRLVKK